MVDHFSETTRYAQPSDVALESHYPGRYSHHYVPWQFQANQATCERRIEAGPWPYVGGGGPQISVAQAQTQPLNSYHSPAANVAYQYHEKQARLVSRSRSIQPDPSTLGLEEQDSHSVEGRSEPVEDQTDGLPDLNTFDDVIDKYLRNLSTRKQDKALIPAKRAQEIKKVLEDPKTTAVQTPQFRFWVKKMFALRYHGTDKLKPWVYNNDKPIAVREKLYKILVHAHRECSHGGRDKTSQEVRNNYSWVPKELIAQFVKACPTCQHRRSIPRQDAVGLNDRKTSCSDTMGLDDPDMTIREDDVDDPWPSVSFSCLDRDQSPLGHNHIRSLGEPFPEPPFRYGGGLNPKVSLPTWDQNLPSYPVSADQSRLSDIIASGSQYENGYTK